MEYRPEIDGLRAVAVLAVLLFHADVSAFSGGFVGVDVFFVISGFLITGQIVRHRDQGAFSLVRFYERRARRILPALFVVLIATLVMGWIWMVPSELAILGENTLAVSLFGSNISLWKQINYFAPAADENPLLHTWSLGVEEQFYLLFPIVLLPLARTAIRWTAVALALGVAFSLGLAQALAGSPLARFYLLPTRAWELLVGSLIAVFVFRFGRPTGRLPAGIAFVGIAMVLVSVAWFNKLTPTPSVWTLLPVGGTALIVLFGDQYGAVGRVLSLRTLTRIGLVSYSAYLWHQPLFAFARMNAIGEPHALEMGAAFVATFVLAFATWRFVERPCRDALRVSTKRMVLLAVGGTALFLGAGYGLAASDGAPNRFTPTEQVWVATPLSDRVEYVVSGFNQRLGQPLSQTQPNLVIIGDSYAQDFFNVVETSAAFDGYSLSTVHISARCQPYLGSEDVSEFIRDAGFAPDLCNTPRLTGDELAIVRNADLVILAADWFDWSAERIGETLAAVQGRVGQQVIVVGSKSFQVSPRQLIGLSPEKAQNLTAPSNPRVATSSKILRSLLPESRFIDLQMTLCGNDDQCPVLTPAGELISYDGGHLTPAGARHLANIVVNEPPLSSYHQPR